MKRSIWWLGALYLCVLLLLWLSILFDTGRLWPVTLYLFSPRWVIALPLLVLAPLTLLTQPRWTFAYGLHVLVILFPLLGYQLASPQRAEPGLDPSLRLLTYNLGEGAIDPRDVARLVQAQQIDAVCFQECPSQKSAIIFDELGWTHHQAGNIALGSRWPLGPAVVLSRQPKAQYSAIAAIGCPLQWPGVTETESAEQIWLVSIHLPTFRPALEHAERLESVTPTAINNMGQQYLQIADNFAAQVGKLKGATVLAGDFNIPHESYFYRKLWSSYRNAFSEAGRGFGYTKFTRFHGVRIDHVLLSPHWTVMNADIGPGLGGDHRPVIVELRNRNRQ